jgi:hypothetical protein
MGGLGVKGTVEDLTPSCALDIFVLRHAVVVLDARTTGTVHLLETK